MPFFGSFLLFSVCPTFFVPDIDKYSKAEQLVMSTWGPSGEGVLWYEIGSVRTGFGQDWCGGGVGGVNTE